MNASVKSSRMPVSPGKAEDGLESSSVQSRLLTSWMYQQHFDHHDVCSTWDSFKEPPGPLHRKFRPEKERTVKHSKRCPDALKRWIVLKKKKGYPSFKKTLGKRQDRMLSSLMEKM